MSALYNFPKMNSMVLLMFLGLILTVATQFATVRPTAHNEDYRIIEGDIMVPVNEPRNALRNVSKLWPNGIVKYYFNDSSLEVTLRAAISKFHGTCVTFVRILQKPSDQENFIHIHRAVNRCASHVGKVGGRQSLFLGKRCNKVRIIVHELVHAIGFWHEQNRDDRDNYLDIHYDNVKENFTGNFHKVPLVFTKLIGRYDYQSLMHYGEHAFTKNGKKTMTPKVANTSIGHAADLSPCDYLKIRMLYNCPPLQPSRLLKNLNRTEIWDLYCFCGINIPRLD